VLLLLLLLWTGPAQAAEPYFVTIAALELQKQDGGWVTVVEPDHRVDLMNTEAQVSFFNNGRVPPGEYQNFRVLFDDAGTRRTITRGEPYTPPLPVRKGSFISVWFILNFELDGDGLPVRPRSVKELRLTVDDFLQVDAGATLTI
jgi:hypothetical protein